LGKSASISESIISDCCSRRRGDLFDFEDELDRERLRQDLNQGNRVKFLVCKSACQKIFVPGCHAQL